MREEALHHLKLPVKVFATVHDVGLANGAQRFEDEQRNTQTQEQKDCTVSAATQTECQYAISADGVDRN